MKNKIKFPFLNLSTGLIAMLCALCLQNITQEFFLPHFA